MHKLENPKRLEELDPKATLKSIGLKQNHVFCDIGAGTGIFTIPASHITNAAVYAVDMSSVMLGIIAAKRDTLGRDNIQNIQAETPPYPIEDGVCDVVLMCTLLHEINDKNRLLDEVRRILAPNGKLAVIEFHKTETPMGPPVRRRISPNEVIEIAAKKGFAAADITRLGDNFYLAVFSLYARR